MTTTRGTITSEEISGAWYYVLRDAETGEIAGKVRMKKGEPAITTASDAWDIAANFGDWESCDHDKEYIHVDRSARYRQENADHCRNN